LALLIESTTMYSPSSSASFSSSCSIDTGHGSRSIHSSIRPASSNHSNHGNDFCSSSSSSHHRWSPMPCNKCRQPIDATAFVCSCDCLFCDGKSDQIEYSSVDAFFTALRMLFVECAFHYFFVRFAH
jgi:Sec7-like guanine-nucleotide exchange factor